MSHGRAKLGTLIRIITGHNALNYFGSKIDAESDPTCRFCLEDDETFWHFLKDCPVFWREQLEFINANNQGKPSNMDWSVGTLLHFAETTKIAMALEGYEDIWFDENEFLDNAQNPPPPEPD
jgi:hypothetical protein